MKEIIKLQQNLETKKNSKLQELFLNCCRKEATFVCIKLLNQEPLFGQIIAFDQLTIIAEIEQKQILLFKNALTSIEPVKQIKFISH